MDFYVSFKREKFTQNLWDTAGSSPTAPTDPFTNSLTESPVNLKEFLSIVCIWWFEVFFLKCNNTPFLHLIAEARIWALNVTYLQKTLSIVE